MNVFYKILEEQLDFIIEQCNFQELLDKLKEPFQVYNPRTGEITEFPNNVIMVFEGEELNDKPR